MSKFKVGDKVRLTEEGFHFYHNPHHMVDSFLIGDSINPKNARKLICELLAVQGIGTVTRFNSEGDPSVDWKFRNAGMFFKYSSIYDIDNVRKLTLLEKLCSFFN
jgi:hypothetical protein